MRTELNKLLKQIRKYLPDADVDVVRRAYRFANEAHEGQARLSGGPYVMHSLMVARILTSLSLDVTTIAAGILHDVLEDTRVTRADLAREFGDEMADLVDGVTKISVLNKAAPTPTQEQKQADNLRKMLVATAKDVRVILIKLADRLHNMRTLEFLPSDKIQRISRETLDIYAPLAHRLGIARWKWELEDHAFHFLYPVEYKEMAAKVAMKRREREAWLQETVRLLEQHLAEAEVPARVIGRPKHLYSIYRKMAQQGKGFDEVMDIVAVRIITQTAADCYNALGVVHRLWTPIPNRVKDYIALPKPNMYQSIHTTVMRETGIPLEIQIRTEDMDRTAREGIASHWRYKEGGSKGDRKLDEQLKWLSQMYEWLKDTHGSDELLDSVRRDFQVSDVYVFTPKGEVKELPLGATPLDLAYLIHSDVGCHCIGSRVNGRMVPLRYNLQTGDVVEILTSKSQTPHRDWLDIVVTGRARTRIRQKLRELGKLDPLDKEFKPPTIHVPPKPVVRPVDDTTREKLIRIEGAKNLVVQFAKCCNPMPGHAVIGYVTKNTGITVHRADCKNYASSTRNANRVIQASWEGEGYVQTQMRATVVQRPNILADITNAMRPMNIMISKAEFRPGENGTSYFDFVFETPDQQGVKFVARTLKTVAGVSEVETLSMKQVASS